MKDTGEAGSPQGKWEYVGEATWQPHAISGSLGYMSLHLASGSLEQ